jgi:hypothetical protein
VRALSTTLLLLGLGIGLAPSLRATTSFNFTSNVGSGSTGNLGQGSVGNTLTFCNGLPSASACSGGQFSVLATAWSTTGVNPQPTSSLQTAAVGQYYPYGLGVCNTVEIAAGCNPPQHAADNSGNVDFILLTFSTPVSALSFNLSTFNTTEGTDLTYFAGNCASTCSPVGKTVLSGGTAPLNSTLFGSNSASFVTNTILGPTVNTDVTGLVTDSITLNAGQPVNWILVGASTTGSGDDFFKLSGMSYSTTPEPATFGLAGAALVALGLLRRKKLLSPRANR